MKKTTFLFQFGICIVVFLTITIFVMTDTSFSQTRIEYSETLDPLDTEIIDSQDSIINVFDPKSQTETIQKFQDSEANSYRIYGTRINDQTSYDYNSNSFDRNRDWVEIMFEDFDTDPFPGGNWEVAHFAGSSECLWDDVDCESYSGNWSLWCADEGYEAPAEDCSEYINDMGALVTYGPFDLSGAESAAFYFYYYLEVEDHYDYLEWGASHNGISFEFLARRDLDTITWINTFCAIDDYGGDSSVWIVFHFHSDGTEVEGEGAYIDDVGISALYGGSAPSAPTGFNAVSGANPGEITMSWNSSSGATGYKIFYDEDSINPPYSPDNDGNPSSGSSVGNVTQITVNGLEPGDWYNCAVSAYNSYGESDYSSEDGAYAPDENYLTISPTSRNHSFSADTGTISVTSNVSWNASESYSWINITSGSSGSGNGTIYYSITENTSSSSRTGTITISGGGITRTFTVYQDGQTSYYLNISPTSRNHSSSADTGTISVTSNVSWNASENCSWITITSGSSGSGNGTVTYHVSENTGSYRTGTITISGGGITRTFTVQQEGPNPPTMTPSATPPTGTAVPTNTPRPPTRTPTRTPTPPQPTSTPSCGNLGVTLWMPSNYFQPGTSCACKVSICNPGNQQYNSVPLFVILDVYGSYFFAPSFSNFDKFTVNVPPGKKTIEVLPSFNWPNGAGSAQNIMWYAAMTNAGMNELFGEMDTWKFGWGS